MAYTDWTFPTPSGCSPAFSTTSSAPRERVPRCQVPGCMADLTCEPKLYCLRKRICTKHMQAEALQYPGNQWCRYCFQCAKVEPLACFDGHKKSCRQALHKRRIRPLIAAHNAATSAATSYQSGCNAVAAVQLQQQQQLLVQMQAAAVPHTPAAAVQNVDSHITVALEALSAAQSMASQVESVLMEMQLARQQPPVAPSTVAAPLTPQTSVSQQQALNAVVSGIAGGYGHTSSGGSSSSGGAAPSSTTPYCQANITGVDTPAAVATNDDGFEAFLQSLLVTELSSANSLRRSTSSSKTAFSGGLGVSSGSNDGLNPMAAAGGMSPAQYQSELQLLAAGGVGRLSPAPSLASSVGGSTGHQLSWLSPNQAAAAGSGNFLQHVVPMSAGRQNPMAPAAGFAGGRVAYGLPEAQQMTAAEQLQKLNVLAQQVQSRVVALAQGLQHVPVAGALSMMA